MSVSILMGAIVSALSAGAASGATDTAKKVVVDAYDGLKSLISRRFGAESEAAAAIDKLEAKPDSEGRRQTLAEELNSVQAGSDPELLSAAQTLLNLVRTLPQGEQHIQTATGSGIAQAYGTGSTATVTFDRPPSKHD